MLGLLDRKIVTSSIPCKNPFLFIWKNITPHKRCLYTYVFMASNCHVNSLLPGNVQLMPNWYLSIYIGWPRKSATVLTVYYEDMNYWMKSLFYPIPTYSVRALWPIRLQGPLSSAPCLCRWLGWVSWCPPHWLPFVLYSSPPRCSRAPHFSSTLWYPYEGCPAVTVVLFFYTC